MPLGALQLVNGGEHIVPLVYPNVPNHHQRHSHEAPYNTP